MTIIGGGVVELRTDDKKLDAGLAGAKSKVTKALDDIDLKAGTVGTSFAQKLGGFMTGAVVGQALGMANSLLGDSIKLAREAEVTETRLAAAVKATGASWNIARKEIDAVVASYDHLAFNDSQVKDALAVLVNETGNYEEALIRLRVAMDFARGAKIELVTAARLLGKVSDENVNVLKRYGIVVAKTATAEEVIAQVQKRFSGQAADYAETSQAAADRAANSWEHAQEVIGGAAIGILGPLSNVSTTVQGFGATFGGLAGGIIGFSKAGAGSVPVITGMSKALGLMRVAASLALGPIGLLIIAAAALAAWSVKNLEAARAEAASTNEKTKAYYELQKTLRDGSMSYDALAISEYEAARAAEALGPAIAASADEGIASIRAISDQLIDLNKMFKPAAADKTEAFLKSIGVDKAMIDTALDALYDTVGADQATRFKKVTDIAYKQLTEEADKGILAEAKANLDAAIAASGTELAKLAKDAGGLTSKQYLAQVKQQMVDAEKRAELYNAQLAKGIDAARDQGQAAIDAGTKMDAHLLLIDSIQESWNKAASAAAYYYRGVLAGGLPSAPKGEPRDVAPFNLGNVPTSGSSGANLVSVVVNQDLNYNGDTAAMATDAANQVIDSVTEAFRQQDRRLAGTAV